MEFGGSYGLEECRGDQQAQVPESSVSPPEVPVQYLPSRTELEEGGEGFFKSLAAICAITHMGLTGFSIY